MCANVVIVSHEYNEARALCHADTDAQAISPAHQNYTRSVALELSVTETLLSNVPVTTKL